MKSKEGNELHPVSSQMNLIAPEHQDSEESEEGPRRGLKNMDSLTPEQVRLLTMKPDTEWRLKKLLEGDVKLYSDDEFEEDLLEGEKSMINSLKGVDSELKSKVEGILKGRKMTETDEEENYPPPKSPVAKSKQETLKAMGYRGMMKGKKSSPDDVEALEMSLSTMDATKEGDQWFRRQRTPPRFKTRRGKKEEKTNSSRKKAAEEAESSEDYSSESSGEEVEDFAKKAGRVRATGGRSNLFRLAAHGGGDGLGKPPLKKNLPNPAESAKINHKEEEDLKPRKQISKFTGLKKETVIREKQKASNLKSIGNTSVRGDMEAIGKVEGTAAISSVPVLKRTAKISGKMNSTDRSRIKEDSDSELLKNAYGFQFSEPKPKVKERKESSAKPLRQTVKRDCPMNWGEIAAPQRSDVNLGLSKNVIRPKVDSFWKTPPKTSTENLKKSVETSKTVKNPPWRIGGSGNTQSSIGSQGYQEGLPGKSHNPQLKKERGQSDDEYTCRSITDKVSRSHLMKDYLDGTCRRGSILETITKATVNSIHGPGIANSLPKTQKKENARKTKSSKPTSSTSCSPLKGSHVLQ